MPASVVHQTTVNVICLLSDLLGPERIMTAGTVTFYVLTFWVTVMHSLNTKFL